MRKGQLLITRKEFWPPQRVLVTDPHDRLTPSSSNLSHFLDYRNSRGPQQSWKCSRKKRLLAGSRRLRSCSGRQYYSLGGLIMHLAACASSRDKTRDAGDSTPTALTYFPFPTQARQRRLLLCVRVPPCRWRRSSRRCCKINRATRTVELASRAVARGGTTLEGG